MIKFNFLGVFFVFVLTCLGVTLAYSVMTQKIGGYLVAFVFLCVSVSLFIRVMQANKKEKLKEEK